MELKFNADNSNNKKFKIEAIWDSFVYANMAKDHLSSQYYLVIRKNYRKEKNYLGTCFSNAKRMEIDQFEL